MSNTSAIMAPRAISNTAVFLGAEKNTCYLSTLRHSEICPSFSIDQLFLIASPELGLYSQTCKRARGLASRSWLGILKHICKLKFFHRYINSILSLLRQQSLKKSGALYKYVSVGVLKWAPSDIWWKYSRTSYIHTHQLFTAWMIFSEI